MTRSATEFVGPLTFQALAGHPVHTRLLDINEENAMGHINLARWADKIIFAPATASIIAKMSHGLADDLLSTLYLAAECPVYIAPAMNQAMWKHTVTQDNIRRLQQHEVTVIGPEAGPQACGETGFGRMTEAEEICKQLLQKHTGPLTGMKLLISAGPTREALDPVRYISNRSSGKMGYAIARAAIKAGAQVTLVSGPVDLAPPPGAAVIKVESAEQMFNTIMPLAKRHDVYIGAAAVADYRPVKTEQHKIKKQGEKNIIHLRQNKDIVAAVAQLNPKPYVVGFAAETHDLETYAQKKLRDKNLDMIAANLVGKSHGGFDSDLNALMVFWNEKKHILDLTDKQRLADQLIELIAERLREKNTA